MQQNKLIIESIHVIKNIAPAPFSLAFAKGKDKAAEAQTGIFSFISFIFFIYNYMIKH